MGTDKPALAGDERRRRESSLGRFAGVSEAGAQQAKSRAVPRDLGPAWENALSYLYYLSYNEDAMLSIRLDPAMDRRLSELARRTGRTKSYYVRELIESNMEDLEDCYLAEARLERPRPSLTSRQVRKQLGLEH